MGWSVRATPLVAATDGVPEPELPEGYLTTIVLGQVLLQGVRMTDPDCPDLTVRAKQNMPRIWPEIVTARWPEGEFVDDARYEMFALGRDLRVREPRVSLRPWKPAIELPASQLVGDMMELPTICGKHVAYYPGILVEEAMHGRFYAFTVSCDCGLAYLIHTEHDGAHCKAGGDPEAIAERYAQVAGVEDNFTNGNVYFRAKRLNGRQGLRVRRLRSR